MPKKNDATDFEMFLAVILAGLMLAVGFVFAVALLGGAGLLLFWASNTIFGTAIPITWTTFLAAGFGLLAFRFLLFLGKRAK